MARDPASYPPTAAPVATVPVPLETPGALATALAKESTQSPAGASRISFEPTSAQLRPGQSATIDVVLDVDPAFVARGAQFGLRFDPNLVAIDKVEPATFFSDWADNHQASWAVLPQWEIYSDTGEVSIAGVVLLGGDRAAPSPAVGPTGAGSLARVYLHALSPGTTHLAILNAVLAVPSVSPFPPAGDIARSAPLATEDAEIVIDNPE